MDPLDFTRFNAAEVHWMEALIEAGEPEHLQGFPTSEKEFYAEPRWLAEYEEGFTVRQAIFRYKDDIAPE